MTFQEACRAVQGLAREGFRPVEVRQGGSGDVDKRGFTKTPGR